VDALIANGAAKVYATACDASQLDYLVAAHPCKVVAVSLDVTDLDAIAKLFTLYPDVNLVINNAGYL
jgi:NADP-dependent 3-hydroxy acid dehydrogenase YdfG